jgi:hypothetical protein
MYRIKTFLDYHYSCREVIQIILKFILILTKGCCEKILIVIGKKTLNSTAIPSQNSSDPINAGAAYYMKTGMQLASLLPYC